jgi:hypothetical protein
VTSLFYIEVYMFYMKQLLFVPIEKPRRLNLAFSALSDRFC